MTIYQRVVSTALYRTATSLYNFNRFISRIAYRLTTWGEKVSGTYFDEDVPF